MTSACTVEPLYNSLFCPGQLANYKRVANYMKQSFFLYNRHQNHLSLLCFAFYKLFFLIHTTSCCFFFCVLVFPLANVFSSVFKPRRAVPGLPNVRAQCSHLSQFGLVKLGNFIKLSTPITQPNHQLINKTNKQTGAAFEVM